MKLLIFLSVLVSHLAFSSDIIFISEGDRRIEVENFEQRSRALVEAFSTGDMVGNGGGLLEQNFYQAYYLIQTAIENCLFDVTCGLNSSEKELLQKINQTYISKIDQARPLVFIKESQSNGFFKEDETKEVRLAKTGFSPQFPIFINSTQGQLISKNIPAMIGILIHELGHQAGVLSHSILDELSTKVRFLWSDSWVENKVHIGGTLLIARLFSSQNNYTSTNLSLVFKEKVKNLDKLIAKKVSCLPGESLYGFYLSNGFWEHPRSTESDFFIALNYWVDIYCLDKNGTIWPIKKDLKIDFKFKQEFDVPVELESIEVTLK